MTQKQKALLNFWGGATLAGFLGWQLVMDNPSWRVRISAFIIPFITSIVQQTRENPLAKEKEQTP